MLNVCKWRNECQLHWNEWNKNKILICSCKLPHLCQKSLYWLLVFISDRSERGTPSQVWTAGWRTSSSPSGPWESSRIQPYEPDTGMSWWLLLESASPWTRFPIYFRDIDDVALFRTPIKVLFLISKTGGGANNLKAHLKSGGVSPQLFSYFLSQLHLHPRWTSLNCLFCSSCLVCTKMYYRD